MRAQVAWISTAQLGGCLWWTAKRFDISIQVYFTLFIHLFEVNVSSKFLEIFINLHVFIRDTILPLLPSLAFILFIYLVIYLFVCPFV